MSKRKVASCGRDLTCVPDLFAALESAGQCGFEFVSIPLVHPRYKREFLRILPERPGPLTRSDKVLSGSNWSTLIVAKISPWIDLDSPDETIRRNSEKAFYEEMSLAMHINAPAILIRLRSSRCANLARCLSHFLPVNPHSVFWIQVPMKDQRSMLDAVQQEGDVKLEDPWEWWNKLRTLCANHRKLAVALEIFDTPIHLTLLERWCCEPLRLGILSTDIFLTNKKGYPTLSRYLQGFMVKLFKLDSQFLLTGACKVEHIFHVGIHHKISDAAQALGGIQSYQKYLNFLYQSLPSPSNMEDFSKGYEDYLQTPLQPLMDNLDSQTYEIFEKDPTKYVQYEKAVAKALVDRVTDEQKDQVTVIMVVGAGRGPLVDASLRAAYSVSRRVMIYAVEKNPGAVITLLNRQAEEWGNKVSVVSCDMRKWEAPEKADILVSELLGSFGDNELSPECLDGAQSFLKPGGISIPCSYTSYLAPLSSPKLHMEVANCRDKDKQPGPVTPYETPFVVQLQNAATLCEPLPCFTFKHPNNDTPINNERYACLHFQVKESHVLHGFAGYFDTILYDDLTLSIVPKTHSDGMISWFPIYFPIKEPIYIPSCSEVEFHIWRLCTDKKVWYEWCVTEPQTTAIHNPNGRSYWIGL